MLLSGLTHVSCAVDKDAGLRVPVCLAWRAGGDALVVQRHWPKGDFTEWLPSRMKDALLHG